MMYLLDTDTLTHLHAGNINVINRLESLQDQEVAITILTKVEILRGRIDYLLKAFSGSDLLKAQELFSRSETLLNQLPIISIDNNTDKLIIGYYCIAVIFGCQTYEK